MIALRKFTTIKNNQIILNMPNDFSENEEVEVIILPKNNNYDFDYWSDEEIDNFGKYSFGLSFNDFDDDNEDYSKW